MRLIKPASQSGDRDPHGPTVRSSSWSYHDCSHFRDARDAFSSQIKASRRQREISQRHSATAQRVYVCFYRKPSRVKQAAYTLPVVQPLSTTKSGPNDLGSFGARDARR